MGKDVKHFRASMGVAKWRQLANQIQHSKWMKQTKIMKVLTVEGLKEKCVQDNKEACRYLEWVMARFDVIEFTDLKWRV